MPCIQYVDKRFSSSSRKIIAKANEIIAEYEAQGFDLTLRQLYYQFVARDLIKNTQKEYKRLGSIINDARLAGQIDWYRITDRTRNLKGLSHWETPADIIAGSAAGFRIDKWKTQKYRPEIWIEKEALAGVFERIAVELDVPYFSCRGYTSQSEMWAAGRRLQRHIEAGQTPVIFHFGDHDPSGLDMTRDIADRLEMFMGGTRLDRLALNMDQIEAFKPPPNPCKMTDARANGYVAEFGDESWELDALDPATLVGIVRKAIESILNKRLWKAAVDEEVEGRRKLKAVSDSWEEITERL
jgi:hypothetical protein